MAFQPSYGAAGRRRGGGGAGGGAAGADAGAPLAVESVVDERAAGEGVTMLSHEGGIYPSPWELTAPYMAEFCGSFLLTLTFIYNYTEAGSASRHAPEMTATANGFMVTAIVYAFGHVSGANLNPAISVSLMLIGRYKARVVGRLCIAQLLGAVSAALVRLAFFSGKVDIGPKEGYSWSAVCSIELLYSAMIVFVYLNCAASIRNNPLGAPNGFVGLAVGCCFIAGGYAAREVSDPVMNSSIAVGLNIVGSRDVGFNAQMLLYIVADFMGAFLGAGAYRIVRPTEDLQSQQDGAESKSVDTDGAKVAAEFFGTFFIILTKALNRTGTAEDTERSGVGPEAWSVAAAITAMVYALRNVSGAHFNPAVTLAATLSGRSRCPKHVAVFCVVSQFIAAVSAGSLFAILNHGQPISLRFGSSYSWEAVVLSEATFSFLITYVLLASTVASDELQSDVRKVPQEVTKDTAELVMPNADVAGLAYGACQTAGGFAAGHISGAMLNPAVVFSFCGIELLKGQFAGGVMVYIFYQVFGALLATGVFMVVHAGLYRSSPAADEKAAV